MRAVGAIDRLDVERVAVVRVMLAGADWGKVNTIQCVGLLVT